jgi:hypothetical protein
MARELAKAAARRKRADDAAANAYWAAMREQARQNRADMAFLREAWASD